MSRFLASSRSLALLPIAGLALAAAGPRYTRDADDLLRFGTGIGALGVSAGLRKWSTSIEKPTRQETSGSASEREED